MSNPTKRTIRPKKGDSAPDPSTADTTTTTLRLVTMNVANLGRSKVAHHDWTREHQQAALKHELLQSHPHILALQECPHARWADETFQEFVAIGSVASHAGFVSLLVRRDSVQDYTRIGNHELDARTPAVLAKLTMQITGRTTDNMASFELYVASMHLEPFEQGSFVRQDQLLALKRAANPNLPLILTGDTNMRDSEDAFAKETVALDDAWKDTGSSDETRYTWDTVDHGDRFNAYYGRYGTRQYQRRYDRIYYHVPENATTGLVATDFALIANRPLGNTNNHFLSDHFGIAASFRTIE